MSSQIEMRLTPGDYISKKNDKYVYNYYYKDYSGNIRAVV